MGFPAVKPAPPPLPAAIARLTTVQQLCWACLHPVRFSQFMLGHDPWDLQQQILNSVYVNRRTAVKACHASGKTFIAADAVLWWPLRYPDGIVITTAPTWTQVRRLLWGEVRKAAALSRIAYPKIFQTEIQLGPDNFAIGLSTNEGVRFQGWHAPHILIVLDEAPGVMTEIWEAIEGVEAGGNVHLLALGNPLSLGGPFYDAFNRNARFWHRFTIDAFSTPNLAGITLDMLLEMGTTTPELLQHNVRPYLTRRDYVFEKYHQWTPESPLWEGKILAQFPRQGDDHLFPLAWVEGAHDPAPAGPKRPKTTTVSAGVDVAGPGENETVLTIVDDWTGDIVLQVAWSKNDPRRECLDALKPYKPSCRRVNVDADGIGYYFAQDIAGDGYPTNFIHVGVPAYDLEPGDDESRYVNLKAQAYWKLRERFDPRVGRFIGKVTDGRLIGQLSGMKYGHDKRGRIEIEQKEKARERGVESPDRAESTMLATMPDTPTAPPQPVQVTTSQWNI